MFLYLLPSLLYFRASGVTLLVPASPHPCQPVAIAGELPCALGRFQGFGDHSSDFVVHSACRCHQLTTSTAGTAWLRRGRTDKQKSAFEKPGCLTRHVPSLLLSITWGLLNAIRRTSLNAFSKVVARAYQGFPGVSILTPQFRGWRLVGAHLKRKARRTVGQGSVQRSWNFCSCSQEAGRMG